MELESVKPAVHREPSGQRQAARSEQKPPLSVSSETVKERLEQALYTNQAEFTTPPAPLAKPERFTLRAFARQLKDAAFKQFEVPETAEIDRQELIVAGENLAASGVDTVGLDGFIERLADAPQVEGVSAESNRSATSLRELDLADNQLSKRDE